MKLISTLKEDTVLDQRPRLKSACLELQQMALDLGVDAKLPTMIELRSQLGMSLRTINDAVRELERRQILRSVNGVGIYVSSSQPQQLTGRIGLLLHVGGITDPYTSELLLGVRREAVRQGMELLFLDEESQTVERGKVDAVLMYCHETEALAMNLPPNLPHVLLFQHSSDFACVAVNDFDGAKMATEHLLELGHTRIGYLLSSDQDSVSRQRLSGYQAAHQESGTVFDEQCVRFLKKTEQQNYLEAGQIAMQSWVNDGWKELGCTAILAHNDLTAISIMKVLNNSGFRVPQDVSVVGFDGTRLSDLCTPPLTTVRVPLYDVGTRAIKTLIEQIKDGVIRQEKVVMPVSFKMGESTSVRNR